MDALIWLLIIWNFIVTCWDAYAAGMLWGMSKSKFERFFSASVFALAFVGFFYTFILVGVAIGVLSEVFMLGTNVVLGAPIILFGIVITVNGWIQAIRERSIVGFLVSIYNTIAIVWDLRVWFASLKIMTELGGLKSLASAAGESDDNKVKVILFLAVGLIVTTLIVVGLFNAGKRKALISSR